MKDKIKNFARVAIRWILLWDIVWGPFLGFLGFLAVGAFIQSLFMTEEGSAAGFYDPSMFQAGVYAVGIMVLFSGSALLGMWINAKGLWKYLYRGAWKVDFHNLTPLQRILIAMAPYWVYMAVMVIIWKTLL